MALLTSLIAPFRQDFESQRAGNGRCLDELHRDGVAEPIRLTGMVTDQGVARLVVAVIVIADRARWHEAVGAGLSEFDEQPCTRDAADTPFKRGADPVREEVRDQPVCRFSLGP